MTATPKNRTGLLVGAIALAVACSGGAYAAGAAINSSAQIKSGVVNTGDIKNGTVKVKDLHKKTVAKLAPALEDWHSFNTPGNPSTVGFWIVEDSASAPLGFRKNADGLVTLRGAATQQANVGSDSTVSTLPAAYRPSECVVFPIASFNGEDGASDEDGAVKICPNGVITMFEETDDRFVSFDGISFYTD